MVAVVTDAFGEIIIGGFTIAPDVNELAARFSRWRRFFAAFLEVVVIVAMVTKNGKCNARCSRTEVTEDRGTNNGFWSAED